MSLPAPRTGLILADARTVLRLSLELLLWKTSLFYQAAGRDLPGRDSALLLALACDARSAPQEWIVICSRQRFSAPAATASLFVSTCCANSRVGGS